MAIVYVIIGLNIAASILAFNRTWLFQKLQFNPYMVQEKREYYRLFSHAFIHASIAHLAVNMFVFFFFGSLVLNFFFNFFGFKGYIYFILLYLGGVVFASLPSLKKHAHNPNYNAVGASGAVSAVLFSHILMLPTNTIMIFPLPIPIPAFIFGVLYLVYERFMEKRMQDNVAHDAHIWGAVFGLGFTGVVRVEFVYEFFVKVGDYLQNII